MKVIRRKIHFTLKIFFVSQILSILKVCTSIMFLFSHSQVTIMHFERFGIDFWPKIWLSLTHQRRKSMNEMAIVKISVHDRTNQVIKMLFFLPDANYLTIFDTKCFCKILVLYIVSCQNVCTIWKVVIHTIYILLFYYLIYFLSNSWL